MKWGFRMKKKVNQNLINQEQEIREEIRVLEEKEVRSYADEAKLYCLQYALKNLLYQKAGL